MAALAVGYLQGGREMATTAAEALRHAKTYHRFMLGLKWVCIGMGTLVTLLVMWFATPAGFWGGLFCAAIVFAVGAWAMNHGLNHSTESDDVALNAAIHGGG
jgi:hypothetical protein